MKDDKVSTADVDAIFDACKLAYEAMETVKPSMEKWAAEKVAAQQEFGDDRFPYGRSILRVLESGLAFCDAWEADQQHQKLATEKIQ